ncbi:serine carboxypeptidase family protein (macronuclear) [Tetrahymena thermophila SB210]|uniref:Carboxypeptidase n=1 Tax=Tetrahymena thermophila (strain SB210) TaxID=312017 RepID=Q22PF3_TETTS|nr:serine carboxypeptidase family protein [Tetrahymena thermophila SB210]EAR87156.1 serine carboxypeptidase family protein [Tetrahymena thermophila SB210]|eukprot:XP_001007401.1 serine carboxypeptidase family protein [Tetrahymena thermophila SB210]
MKYLLIFTYVLLLATNFVEARNTTCNKFVDQYAPFNTFFTGYLNPGFDDQTTGLGFVFYSKQNATTVEEIAEVPTLIWLNGGPGSPSMQGAYFENGPYRVLNISGQKVIQVNPDAWTNKYNVLYIDQPIAVGFSRSLNDTYLPKNITVVAQQFYQALLSFYSGNGCYNNTQLHKSPIFITGESYAGKYIPNIAAEIIKQNKIAAATGNIVIPLQGVSIGDPFIDPQHQFYQLGEFGIQNGLITEETRQKLEVIIDKMRFYIDTKDNFNATMAYNQSISFFMENSIYPLQNFYNFKIGPYPDDFVADHCQDYIKQFGFDEDFTFGSTNIKIAKSLFMDNFNPNAIPALQYILSNKLPVIIYNGDNDIAITSLGVKTSINNFSWEGQQIFSRLPMSNITNNKNKTIAAYKNFLNLHLATILDAGHLVPYDQPESMNIILDNFIDSALKTTKTTTKQH